MIAPPVRVLCVSPFFAPLANAEAFCGGKVALDLLAEGVDLTVLTVDYSSHHKFSYDSSDLWAPLRAITHAIPPHGETSKFFSAPLGLRFCSPDWARWLGATLAKARQLHRRPFDVIYSRGIPNVAHIAAFWISRTLRRPWVANLNDPWDLEATHLLPQFRHRRKLTARTVIQDLWLRRVLASADVLTFPCSRLRDYHLRLGRVRGSTFVLPHSGRRAAPRPRAPGFQVVHAGNLGSGESTRRNSTNCLLAAIRGLLDRFPEARSNLRLSLVGAKDTPTLRLADELGLSEFVSCTGRVSYSESLRHIAAASVCLLVEGNMPEGIYLPSKFADYVTARKPVVALSPRVGTISDLERYRGVARANVDDPAAIEAVLERYYRAFTLGQLENSVPEESLMSQFDGAAIAGRLHTLLRATAGGTLHEHNAA